MLKYQYNLISVHFTAFWRYFNLAVVEFRAWVRNDTLFVYMDPIIIHALIHMLV